MSTMTPVPKDHPLMVAWEKYKATEDYANTRKWALHDAYADGSLWAAFEKGWNGAPAELEPLRERVKELEAERGVADKLEGTFWDALKLLNLPAIRVENPGSHFVDVIRELQQLRAERDELRRKLEVDKQAHEQALWEAQSKVQ